MSAIVPGQWFPDRLRLRIEAAREAIELVRRAPHLELPASALNGWYAADLLEAGDTATAMAAVRDKCFRGRLLISRPYHQPLIQTGGEKVQDP